MSELEVTKIENEADSTAVQLNRKSTDGTIVDLRKDDVSVGSIAAFSSDLVIGTGDTGLRFKDGTDEIFPVNTSTGAATDGTIDIGGSTERFKDLYLSGGAYIGGTGVANYLDDYEEGTWTPQVFDNNNNQGSTGSASGTYTKIGNMVNLVINIDNIDTTGLNASDRVGVGNLPFAQRSGSDFTVNAVRSSSISITNGPLIANLFHNSGALIQFLDGDGQGFLGVGDLTSGAADLRFSLTYYT